MEIKQNTHTIFPITAVGHFKKEIQTRLLFKIQIYGYK